MLVVALGSTLAFEAAPAQSSPSGFVSDDFSSGLDLSRWTVVDPAGDGDVAVVGAGGGDAHLALSVPAGASHDAWTTNDAVRAVQSVADADVEVEASFGSTPSSRFQMQGLMAAQADGEFVRFGTYHDGSALRVFAAVVSASSARTEVSTVVSPGDADVLRLSRSGQSWTLSYAPEPGGPWATAVSFQDDLALASLGVYVGNHAKGGAAPPAYTALVDYVFDVSSPIEPEDGGGAVGDTTPPVISDVGVEVAATSATVSWTTDEEATSAVDLGPTTAYGTTVEDVGYTTAHSVVVTGLDPGTPYEFSVRSADAAGNESSSDNDSFTTAPAPPAAGFVSDDFSSGLDLSRWTVVDPAGDGSVTVDAPSSCAARLAMSVPGGSDHDPWTTNGSLRAMQSVGDADLDIVAGFDSTPSARYQMQGLLVEQDPGTYVRFGVHHDGSALRVYGATFAGGTATTRVNTAVADDAAQRLRVERAGDAWTLSYAGAGATSWTAAATFTFAADVSTAGVFAGNSGSGSTAPAHTALVDYAFDAAAPIDPEDGGGECVAHELTTTVTGAGSVARSPSSPTYAPGTQVSLTAVPDAGWAFAGWGGAASGGDNPVTVTMDAPLTVTATFVEDGPPPPGAGPTIDVWYGDEQTVGALGRPQTWANVLGRVSDPDGVAALSYTLNGGPSSPLSVGSDQRRLYGDGDFNVEIDVDALSPGANDVVLTAEDGVGDTTTSTVTVHRVTGTTWPLPYSTDWAGAGSIGERAQVVDGLWQLDGATVSAIEPGYDRTLALGDLSWTDYEVTVPVTVHGLAPGYGTPSSGDPLVGMGIRWQGHSAVGGEQPRQGWYPTGAFMWWRGTTSANGRYRLYGNDGQPVESFTQPALQFGATMLFKVRVESVAGGTEYRAKVWEAGAAEPASWSDTILDDDSPPSGGVLLIAHHVVAAWGDVVVTPIEP